MRHSAVTMALTGALSAALLHAPAFAAPRGAIDLEPCEYASFDGAEKVQAQCGVLMVPEDRAAAGSRLLPIKVTVLPPRNRSRANEVPIFVLPGGPGQRPASLIPFYATHKARDANTFVFTEMRGAGDGHLLNCENPGRTNPQRFLEPIFSEVSRFAACRDALSKTADLNQYTMINAMRDVDDVRAGLGHEKIMLDGGSYGTRAALVYMRMFPQRVRAATLAAVTPFENRTPLQHSAAAQRAFDRLIQDCGADASCGTAFPNIEDDFEAVRVRLLRAPVDVTITDDDTGKPATVKMDYGAFADGLRVLLYYDDTNGRIPLLLNRARKGDLAPFAQAAYSANRSVWEQVPLGMLLSYTCSEDVARIRPEDIAAATANTFLGDIRVRGQIAACDNWVRHPTAREYSTPFTSDIPTLVFSGRLDPVTPPEDGEILTRSLRKSRHIVFPGAHGTAYDCREIIAEQFYRTGSIDGLDLTCVASAPKVEFEVPAQLSSD